MKRADNVQQLLSSVRHGRFTLDGSHLIIKNSLYLDRRGLESLVGCPHRVEGNFSCGQNFLTTLEGGPVYVEQQYYASFNKLENLQHTPKIIKGGFYASNNLLQTLINGPEKCYGGFMISDNHPLKTFKGLPRDISNKLVASNISDFHNVHTYFDRMAGEFESINAPPMIGHSTTSPININNVLGLLLIPGITSICVGQKSALYNIILNKYVGYGKKILYKAAQDLITNGYPHMARI